MARRCARRRSRLTTKTTAGRRPFRRTATARTAPGRKHCRTAALRCKSDIVARKPIAETWESFTERQIREAQQAGEFDALEGEGRPLQDLDEPHDEFWWVKRKLRREQLSFVPDAIAIRREAEIVLGGLREVATETEARAVLVELYARCRPRRSWPEHSSSAK